MLISIALAPGELVKDGFFTLFESVSALEVSQKIHDSEPSLLF